MNLMSFELNSFAQLQTYLFLTLPLDKAQDRPFDRAQDRPFDYGPHKVRSVLCSGRRLQRILTFSLYDSSVH